MLKIINKIKRHSINLIPPVSRILLEKEFSKITKVKKNWGCILEIGPKTLGTKQNIEYTKYQSLDISTSHHVDINADIHDSGIDTETYDTIFAKEVLEHLYNPQKAINELYRILKKNGTLIFSTRFIYPYHEEPFDYFRFTKYGLRELLKDFDEITIISQGSWLINLWDMFTHSFFLFPLRIFNFIFVPFNYKKSIFPSGFVVIAKKINYQ